MIRAVPPRFVLFAAICGAWLAAMQIAGESSAIYAAGVGWFATWSAQIGVSLALRIWPFTLPDIYYRPLRRRLPRRVARALGMDVCRHLAQRIHPFPCDRASLRELIETTGAAETTHIISFALVATAGLTLAAQGHAGTAASVLLWNIVCNLYPAVLQRYTRARISRGSPIRITVPSRTPSHSSTPFPASTMMVEP